MRVGFASLVFVALLAPSLAWGSPLRGGRVVVLDSPRAPSTGRVATLPAQAWRSLEHVELPARCATPAVTLPDDTIAVGLDAPPGIAFVSRDGASMVSVRLRARITQPLAVGLDGRVFVVTGRDVLTASPDGAVRSSVRLPGNIAAPVVVRADGSAVVIATPSSNALIFGTLSASGALVRSVELPASMIAAGAFDDGRVAVVTTERLVVHGLDGAITSAAVPTGLRGVVPMRDRMAFTVDDALLFADARGVVEARVALRGIPLWATALESGRLAVSVVLPDAPSELSLLGRDGSSTAGVPLPPGASAPLVDPTGALCVVARSGEVLAIDPDGRERWRISLRDTLRTPAAPLARGGVAIATERNVLLLVNDAP